MVLSTIRTVGYATPIALAILLLVLTLVIWKPRGLKIGFSAAIGGFLALISGIVSWQNVVEVWDLVSNGTFTVIALVIISLILDEAGVFRWLALHLAGLGMGRGRFLFTLVLLLGAVVTALLTNYGTVLIWTPTVMEMVLILGFSRKATLAFVTATGFIADATSLPLPVSNLVNIITSEYFKISFWRYALVMVPINFVTVVTSLCVLWFYFDRDIPLSYNLNRLLPICKGVIRDPIVFRWSFPILGLLLLGYFLAKLLSIPVFFVAALGAFVMVGLAGRWFHRHIKRTINLSLIFREVPWQVILFSLGMYVVIFGLRNTGLIAYLSNFLTQLSKWKIALATTGTGFLAGLVSSVTNNLPAVLINAIAIQDATDIDPAIREAMVYANAIGCTIGAKITPIGSFATLLWLGVLARKGFRITLSQYVCVSIILTLPVLFVTLLSLAIWLPWLIA